MLRAESISKRYSTRAGELTVLRDVSLELAPGAAAVIVGPSGAGKSTLLNILGTLDRPTSGRVELDGSDPLSLPPRALARFRNRMIGFVFQNHHLLPQCSVLENVILPTLAGRPAPDAEQRARLLIERVGLSARSDHRPAELSGGERQRVAIARALINRPRLVLADEPTGNLDRATGERVADLLVELLRDQDVMLVLVTHNEALAARFDARHALVDGALLRQDAGEDHQ
jgi:lipoprotein-releasing system ATP-binding protein